MTGWQPGFCADKWGQISYPATKKTCKVKFICDYFVCRVSTRIAKAWSKRIYRLHLWPVWVKSVDPWTPFLFFTMKFGNTKTLISDLLITSVCHVGFDQALNRAVKTRDELHWMFHHYPPIHYDTMSQNRSPWVPQLRAGGCRCFL